MLATHGELMNYFDSKREYEISICFNALMDDETTFLITQQVADTTYTDNINPPFRDGK